MLLFEEEGKAKIGHGGDGTPAIGHVGIALAADQGNGGVADHGEGRAGNAGMVAVFAITAIAHIEDAILNGPVMAQGHLHPFWIQRFLPTTGDPGERLLTGPIDIVQPLARAPDPTYPADL